MKRIGIIISAALAALLASCSYDAISPEQGVDSVQPAPGLVPLSISTGTQTKTVLSGTTVNWTADDQIAVFDDLHCLNCFDAVSVSGSSAVFEGKVAAKTTDFYAVYPYAGDIKADAENIYVNLPSEQTSKSGSFAEEHNISVAHGTKSVEADEVDGVVFRNVCSLIKFTLPDKLSKISEVSFTASGRMLAGNMTIAKSDYGVNVKSGSSTVKMKGSFGAGSTFYFVVAPGTINGFSIKVTAENGANYTKSSTKSFSADAGMIKDLGVIELSVEPKVWAEHVYPSGKLSGTSVMLDLGLPPGMEEYVDRVEAYVQKDGQGNVYRSIALDASRNEVRPSVEMKVPYGNSYMQRGEYVAHITYYMNGKTIERDVAFTVPVPDIYVTASAYTSYSKYSSGYVSEANACNAETIYDIRCSVNVSDDLLSSFGLSGCVVGLKKSGVENILNRNANGEILDRLYRSNFFELASLSGQAWGEYQLTAKVTFDGITRSSSPVTLHITGLPYTASPPSNGGAHPWSGSAYGWDSGFVRLHAHTISQTFHAPGNIGVTASQDVRIYTRWYPTEYAFKVSGTTLYSKSQSSTGGSETKVNASYSATLTSSNPVVSLSNSNGSRDVGLEYTNVKVYSVSVKYR